jgi:hypothetical protein
MEKLRIIVGGYIGLFPSGAGLFSFDNVDLAIEAIIKVRSNIDYHSARAKGIAAEYFDSNKVLTKMLEQLN